MKTLEQIRNDIKKILIEASSDYPDVAKFFLETNRGQFLLRNLEAYAHNLQPRQEGLDKEFFRERIEHLRIENKNLTKVIKSISKGENDV